jgi:hypothetical protein
MVGLVLGIALVLLGVFGAIAAAALLTTVGPDGEVGLSSRVVARGAAITVPQLDVPALPGDRTVTLDVSVRATDGEPVFLGVAPSAAVATYLRGVPVDVLAQIDWPGAARTEAEGGDATATPPGDQTFWIVASQGKEPRLHWNAPPGEWTLVIMRPDGGRGIDVTATAAITVPFLGPAGIAAAVIAAVALAAGILVTFRTARRPRAALS